VEEVDTSDTEPDTSVTVDEDPGEDGDPEDVTDAPPARVARSDSALVFDISPEDAVVYVDDEYEGTAADLNALEDGLRVPPGEHVVTVLRPGFHDSIQTVETRAGKSTNIDVDLTR
jgi:PEGA domain